MSPSLFDDFQQIATSFSVPLGTVGIAFVGIWLAHAWTISRLKEAIKHEYAISLQEHRTGQEKELQIFKAANDTLLQEHKREQDRLILDHRATQDRQLQQQRDEFETKLHMMKHENEVGQLRTSLFFKHQQEAFQAILIETAFAISCWGRKYDPVTCIWGRIPESNYEKIESTIRNYQLFLDPDCKLALDILINVYQNSFPFDDGHGEIAKDGRKPLSDAEYLQPRLAALFQMKIGVPYEKEAFLEIALLGIVRLLSQHFQTSNDLSLKMLSHKFLDTEDSVALAKEQFVELNTDLQTLLDTLRSDGWASNKKYTQLKKLLGVIRK
ncbi:hypothetical protein ACO0K9_27715 [Undibacterium sp. Ji50W]|uniref:hypothetical protein n=1 Tax=Undibacterium sp. Ji50W TaxID=3413041 RepID=UPI003BF22675